MRTHPTLSNAGTSRVRFARATYSLLLLSFIFPGNVVRAQDYHIDEPRIQRLQTYEAMLQLLDKYYIDSQSVRGKIDSLMHAILGSLDPHTFYMPAEDVADSKEHYGQGSIRYGFNVLQNVSHRLRGKPLVVSYVDPESDARKAGLLPGDVIQSLNGRGALYMSEEQFYKLLYQRAEATIKVSRKGRKNNLTLVVTSGLVPNRSVLGRTMLDSETAYVSIEDFIEPTAGDFVLALEDLARRGMRRLLLDLRNNRGGYLTQTLECTSLFFREGTLLLSTANGRLDRPDSHRTIRDGRFADLPMVVLVGSGTASAGEVMSGTLQDHDRALLLGQPTFGKGLVQRQYDLPDGGAFRMTTSRYLLPSGRCIQRAYKGGEYVAEPLELPDLVNIDHRLDTQAMRVNGFKTSNGRYVYDQQGVVPDILHSPQSRSQLIQQMIDSGAASRFCVTYLINNGEFLSKKTLDEMTRSFELSSATLPLVERAANDARVPSAAKRIRAEKAALLSLLKKYLIWSFFGEEGWARALLEGDRQVQHALEISRTAGTLVTN